MHRLISLSVFVNRITYRNRRVVMSIHIENCWEIKKCGRQAGGNKVAELGECITSVENMGHSCWAIAGTLCGGEIQGTAAKKEKNCMVCEVYQKYHRSKGSLGEVIAREYPEEETKYKQLLRSRIKIA